MSKADWDTLRKAAYREASYRCTVCFGKGRKHPVEAHEVWTYEEPEYIQRLVDIVALCPDCHKVKHMGLSIIQGWDEYAREHLAKVNGWDRPTAARYEEQCFDEWKRRSMFHWSLDISWLKGRGVCVPKVLDRMDWKSSPLPQRRKSDDVSS